MEMLLIIAYSVIGSKCIKYCKYHIFGVQAEFYAGTALDKFLFDLVKGCLFGWLAIPVALLHKIFFGGTD